MSFLLYLTHPFETPIFPFTWSAAWVVFIGALVASKRWTHLGLLRGALVGISPPFGGTGLFEIVYQFTGARVQSWAFHMSAYDWFGLVPWTAVGLTSLPLWKLTWDYWALVGLTTTGFLAWALVGFPQVTWGTIQQIPVAYAFNIALKGAAYLVFLPPTVRGFREQSRPSTGQTE
jgi:hypothetical protein